MKKGRMVIDPQFLLTFLQFPQGELIHAELNEHGFLVLTIADSEMPNVETGNAVPIVSPAYIMHEDCQGHWVSIREPLKGV